MKSLRSFRMFFVVLALMLVPSASFAAVVISVGFAPPVLPVYTQPVCPGDGYLWTPGYWAYGPGGYYWVPGVWVQPPMVGVLWTPGYWGWGGGAFLWHAGYWGPHVGFYGGINYGFGYGGVGFEGGFWRGGAFQYNRAVMNINVGSVHNVYVHNVTVVNNNFAHTSFNGGNGGVPAHATAQEMAAEHEQHIAPTANQVQHQTMASQNRAQFASANGGHPPMAAQPRVGDTAHAVAATGAPRNLVNQREGNQQQRIANGVRSGQMTSGEAARADQRQAKIDSQVHQDRQANGGKLTQQQRQQVNKEQNAASRQIHNENHNAAKDEKAK